jgi:hypothetical protein
MSNPVFRPFFTCWGNSPGRGQVRVKTILCAFLPRRRRSSRRVRNSCSQSLRASAHRELPAIVPRATGEDFRIQTSANTLAELPSLNRAFPDREVPPEVLSGVGPQLTPGREPLRRAEAGEGIGEKSCVVRKSDR